MLFGGAERWNVMLTRDGMDIVGIEDALSRDLTASYDGGTPVLVP